MSQDHIDEVIPVQQREPHRLLIQSIFCLLGVGILVPWNAFISAKDYYESRFCESKYDKINLESSFAMSYNLASVVSLGFIIFGQWLRDQCIAVKDEQRSSVAVLPTGGSQSASLSSDSSSSAATTTSHHAFWLVMVPLSLYLAVFCCQTILVLWIDISATTMWIITILSLILSGLCSAIASAGIVAAAGLFEIELAMNPFLAGQSVGGVAVSLANFVAAIYKDPGEFWNQYCVQHTNRTIIDEQFLVLQNVLMDRDLSPEADSFVLNDGATATASCAKYGHADWAVLLYFFLGSCVLIACLFGYAYIARYQQSHHRDDYVTVDDTDDALIHVHGDEEIVDDSPQTGVELLRKQADIENEATESPLPMNTQARSPCDRLLVVHGGQEGQELPAGDRMGDNEEEDETEPRNETLAVWKHVKGSATSIFLVFFVTLSLFPGWVSDLRSIYQCQSRFRIFNDLYMPWSFLFFNIGDLTGRLLSAKIPTKRIHKLPSKLVVAALARFVFFPMLLACAANKVPPNWWYVQSDMYSLSVQFAFAVTNGLLVSTAFAVAPSLLPQATMSSEERMSEILTFAVVLGLLAGSLFSYPVSQWTTGLLRDARGDGSLRQFVHSAW